METIYTVENKNVEAYEPGFLLPLLICQHVYHEAFVVKPQTLSHVQSLPAGVNIVSVKFSMVSTFH